MEIGQRVRILSSKKKSYQNVIGKFGTIKMYDGISLGISVDNSKNNYSALGLYWIEPKEIELVEKQEEEKMENLKGYKAVAVLDTGCLEQYCAIYEDGNDYQVNDVVTNSLSTSALRIKEIITPEEAKKIIGDSIKLEVTGKVDLSAYEARTNRRKEAKRLKKEMDEKIKAMDEVNKYEMYAKQNPELEGLLKQYKELVG